MIHPALANALVMQPLGRLIDGVAPGGKGCSGEVDLEKPKTSLAEKTCVPPPQLVFFAKKADQDPQSIKAIDNA
jgi:hypothetical protein